MPVPPQDRPLASVREETIDRLIVNYGHGDISLEAFERRLDQALDAKSADELMPLTADLELQADKAYAQQKRAEFGLQTQPIAEAGDVNYMIHVFGGGTRSGAWTVPREIRMLNLFGGGEVDFSVARFSAPVTHIRLLCLFGGANFYVNENINVESHVVCLFGGMHNRGPSNPDPNVPTVVIDGLVLFGGADVRIKKSMKERWLEFADHVKSAFGEIHHTYTTAQARANPPR